MTIAEASNRMTTVMQGLEQAINDSVDNSLPEIANMNREQLTKGLTSDGKEIGDKPPFNYAGYYDSYAEYRDKMGLQTDFIDLNITGKFYESIFAKRNNEKITIFSNDDPAKVEALMHGGGPPGSLWKVRRGGFGEQILGLLKSNKNKIQKKIYIDILFFVKKITNFKINEL